MFGFWGGLLGVPEQQRRDFLEALGKQESDLFPLRVVAQSGFSSGAVEVDVPGWVLAGGT